MSNETEPLPQPPPRQWAKKGPSRLANFAPQVVGPVFTKRGFAGADLAVHWPEIVGAGVARHTRPIGLVWPRGGAENGLGATLNIACSGSFALDLQQMTPVIIERLNRRLGWRCVTRLGIKQMPVRPVSAKPVTMPPNPEDVIEAGRIAAGIRNDTLRDAVTRLGAATLARSRRTRQVKRQALAQP